MKVVILFITVLVTVGAEVAKADEDRTVELVCEKDTENKHRPGCLISCDAIFWDTEDDSNKEYLDRYNVCKNSASQESLCDRSDEIKECFLFNEAYDDLSDEFEEIYRIKKQ